MSPLAFTDSAMRMACVILRVVIFDGDLVRLRRGRQPGATAGQGGERQQRRR